MSLRPLGPFTVAAIGLGCMNICHAYGEPPPREQAVALLHAALAACRELGVSFVAFSPVARGFLAGALPDQAAVDALPDKDLRRPMPRFAPEHYARNLRLLHGFRAIAAELGCTPAQLALAWLLHQGEDILPIPGTRSIAHLHENLGASGVRLSPEVLNRLEALINPATVSGHRYAEQARREIDTEDSV